MSYKPTNFREKFGLFSEQWQPKVIAEMNDYQFKVVKLQHWTRGGRADGSERRVGSESLRLMD